MAIKPEGAKQILYLFTTREEPADQVAALYGRRWTIETDLRSLKEQVRLHRIEAKSPDMVASELYLAVATWNLIRAVMQEAAQQAGVEPRRLSFSRARAALLAFAQASLPNRSPQQRDRGWELVLHSIAHCRLPQRKRPYAPRLVWPTHQNFPSRKVSERGEGIYVALGCPTCPPNSASRVRQTSLSSVSFQSSGSRQTMRLPHPHRARQRFRKPRPQSDRPLFAGPLQRLRLRIPSSTSSASSSAISRQVVPKPRIKPVPARRPESARQSARNPCHATAQP